MYPKLLAKNFPLWLALAGLLIIALAISSVVMASAGAKHPNPTPKAELLPGTFVQLTGDNSGNFGDWSKDGKYILYDDGAIKSDGQWGKRSIWRVPVKGGDAKAEYLGEGKNPRYSPDGKFIAFNVNVNSNYGSGDLWIMDSSGTSASRRLIRKEPLYSRPLDTGQWLKDNTIIFEDDREVEGIINVIYNPATQARRELKSEIGEERIFPSPDGHYVFKTFVRLGQPEISLESLDEKINVPRTNFTDRFNKNSFFQNFVDWSPDSRKLSFVTYENKFDYSKNPAQPSSLWIYTLHLISITDDKQPRIEIKSIDLFPKQKILNHWFLGASWSPDSRNLVVGTVTEFSEETQIQDKSLLYVENTSYLKLVTFSDDKGSVADVRTLATVVTNNRQEGDIAWFFPIAWSPDSKRLAWQERYLKEGDEYEPKAKATLVDLESNTTLDLPIPYSGIGGTFKFSPDGMAIAMSGRPSRQNRHQDIFSPTNVWIYYLNQPNVQQPVLKPTVQIIPTRTRTP